MKLNLKKVGVISALGLALSVALGFLLTEFAIEPQTGFFYKGYHTMGVLISVLIFVIAFFCFALAAASNVKPVAQPLPSKLFAVGNFAIAAAVVYESLFTQVGVSVPSWQTLLLIAFGLFSAALFVLNGLSEFGISDVSKTFDIVFILAWLVRVMIVFSNYIPSSTLCENVFEMAALCLSLIFFLTAGKMRCGVNADKKSFVIPVAILAAIICCAYSIPQIVDRLFFAQETASGGGTFLSDLACGFYMLTFIYKYFADRKPVDKPEENSQEKTEENAEENTEENAEETSEPISSDYSEFIEMYSPVKSDEQSENE